MNRILTGMYHAERRVLEHCLFKMEIMEIIQAMFVRAHIHNRAHRFIVLALLPLPPTDIPKIFLTLKHFYVLRLCQGFYKQDNYKSLVLAKLYLIEPNSCRKIQTTHYFNITAILKENIKTESHRIDRFSKCDISFSLASVFS